MSRRGSLPLGVALCVASTGIGALFASSSESGSVSRSVSGSVSASVSASVSDSVSASETVSDPRPDPSLRDVGGARFARGATITGATPHRLILFTFDDGPDKRTTPRLLDQLDAEGIKAIFFVTTSRFGDGAPWERQNAELVREIARRGHLIGNHTHHHLQLPLLQTAEAQAEIDRSALQIERTIGRRSWLMRPPGGALSPRIKRLLAAQGYTTVLWNLGAGDLMVESPQAVVRTWERVLGRREREFGDRGGIILLHDTQAQSVQAFPRIVEVLRSRNCELLERGEELYDIVDDLSLFYQPAIEGAPDTTTMPMTLPVDVLEARQDALRRQTAKRCRTVAELH